MRQIPSSKGHMILCDDEDFARLSAFKWYAHNNQHANMPRPARRLKRHEHSGRKVVFLVHELLGQPPAGKVIDHINGDPWDNRRCNLRFATVGENNRNQRRKRKADGSGKGVYWLRGAWVVRISRGYTCHQFSSWDNLLQAELAYDALALHLHGEFANLNHPHIPTRARSPEEVDAELKARRPSARVLPFLKAGLTATEAARLANCSTATAANVARQHGLQLVRGRPRKAA